MEETHKNRNSVDEFVFKLINNHLKDSDNYTLDYNNGMPLVHIHNGRNKGLYGFGNVEGLIYWIERNFVGTRITIAI